MNKFAILGAVVALSLQPATVQAQDGRVLKTFSTAELHRALDAISATYVDAGDDRSINITFQSSLRANAAIMVCDDVPSERNCLGTSILAIFDPEAGTTQSEIAEAINTYNYNQNFGRAYIDPNGDISVRLYIIADGGLTRENYRRQIELWSYSLERFSGYLFGEETKTKGK